MDPLSAIAAAVSVLDLLGMCLKAGKAGRDLQRAYVNAPVEIATLIGKLDVLRFWLEQVEALAGDLSGQDADDLFPHIHRVSIMAALQQGAAELASITSLHHRQQRISRGVKLRWAALDRTKAMGILSRIRDVEQTLNVCIGVVSV